MCIRHRLVHIETRTTLTHIGTCTTLTRAHANTRTTFTDEHARLRQRPWGTFQKKVTAQGGTFTVCGPSRNGACSQQDWPQ